MMPGTKIIEKPLFFQGFFDVMCTPPVGGWGGMGGGNPDMGWLTTRQFDVVYKAAAFFASTGRDQLGHTDDSQ